MKRLQFPTTSKDIQRYLKDDHEWMIITDLKLNMLGAARGSRRSCDEECIKNAFQSASQVLNDFYPKEQHRKLSYVYCLHTHPQSIQYPSQMDLLAFFNLKKNHQFGFHVMGYGVITSRGVSIIKFPEDKEKLWAIDIKPILTKYTDRSEQNVMRTVYKKLIKQGIPLDKFDDHYESLPIKEHQKIMRSASHRAFRDTFKEEPDIETKIIRKKRWFTMARRR